MRYRTALTAVVVSGITLIALALAPAAPPPEQAAGARGGPPQRDALRAYLEGMRADLSNGKVSTYNAVMRLSDEEAKIFWPIYKDYEDELFENGDRRVALVKEYVSLSASKGVTDDKARELMPKWFEFHEQQLNLLKKYQGIIQEKVSPIRAAQFVQIEYRFSLVVDLTVASELPLVEGRGK